MRWCAAVRHTHYERKVGEGCEYIRSRELRGNESVCAVWDFVSCAGTLTTEPPADEDM